MSASVGPGLPSSPLPPRLPDRLRLDGAAHPWREELLDVGHAAWICDTGFLTPRLDDDQCRHLGDAEALRQVRVLVDVDEVDTKRVVISSLLKDICEDGLHSPAATGRLPMEEDEARSLRDWDRVLAWADRGPHVANAIGGPFAPFGTETPEESNAGNFPERRLQGSGGQMEVLELSQLDESTAPSLAAQLGAEFNVTATIRSCGPCCIEIQMDDQELGRALHVLEEFVVVNALPSLHVRLNGRCYILESHGHARV